jgi:hypothetical protein
VQADQHFFEKTNLVVEAALVTREVLKGARELLAQASG